ncbi:MAG TPA: AfsR/SARP family transcriptional regulator [Pseudonocardia sp.]|nr:AfsR/SARP family transcriptional regulator [Pseudonocardia sp.]
MVAFGDTSARTDTIPQQRGPRSDVTFRLLGQLEILKDDVDHAPTAPKILQLVGLLLMSPGRVVHVDSIVEELWADEPPRSVRTTMQTYVYHLRRCLEHNLLVDNAEQMLSTRNRGYVLRIHPSQVDVFTFQRLCREGQQLLDAHRHHDAARTFRSALDLWSGPPMANINCGPVLSAFAVNLQEQRRHAQHLRIEAEIEDGAGRGLIGELHSLAAANRLDEVLHGQLIRVLARSGRRSDAMSVYRDLHGRLTTELGIEPSDELQALHMWLLSIGEPSR